jgi:hypothetical protein
MRRGRLDPLDLARTGFEPMQFLRHPERALRAGLAALVIAATLAGCTQSEGDAAATGVYRLLNSPRNPAIETLERGAEFAVVPPGRALVHSPQALLVLERNMGGAVEQRVILPNDTAIGGDNVLHLRAQTATSARAQEFNLDEIAARFGGLPAPFGRAEPGSLLSGSDALGGYVYARHNVGVDTVCVLVLRRLTAAARPLPQGIHALDVVLRNCVVGSLEQALAPMGDRALAVAAAPQGTVYTLSPFAAPRR